MVVAILITEEHLLTDDLKDESCRTWVLRGPASKFGGGTRASTADI
uniref:Uncharacterized protein n=1 Tax=Moniliophthora roreri TaxID=221103 RepID=A0A0W0G0Z9_MONRR